MDHNPVYKISITELCPLREFIGVDILVATRSLPSAQMVSKYHFLVKGEVANSKVEEGRR